MKANRTNILKNDTGDVGIGTLIIFIAMVLVAAVAAAVLIQTSGILQQKAQTTGKEATAEVSSNLKAISVVGTRSDPNNGGPVDNLSVLLQLTAGGADIDFKTVIVKYINESSSTTLHWDNNASATAFNYTEVRSISGLPDDVLQPGDIGVITIDLSATGQQLVVRKKATIEVIPEVGTMITKDIVAPATFNAAKTVQLFP
jgi:flagellin FlaB